MERPRLSSSISPAFSNLTLVHGLKAKPLSSLQALFFPEMKYDKAFDLVCLNCSVSHLVGLNKTSPELNA